MGIFGKPINAANANGEADVANLAAGGTHTLDTVYHWRDGPNGLPSVTAAARRSATLRSLETSSTGVGRGYSGYQVRVYAALVGSVSFIQEIASAENAGG